MISKKLFLQLRKIYCSKISWVGLSYTFNKCQQYLTFIAHPQNIFHKFTWYSLSHSLHVHIYNWGVEWYTQVWTCTAHWSRSISCRCICSNVNMITVAQISIITLLINKYTTFYIALIISMHSCSNFYYYTVDKQIYHLVHCPECVVT